MQHSRLPRYATTLSKLLGISDAQKNAIRARATTDPVLCFYFLGCGERFPLNDSNYRASSSDEQPARFAALDTSNPKASQVSWCREVNDIGGYIEINLGTARLNVRLFFNGNILLLIFESFAIVFSKFLRAKYFAVQHH